MVRSRTNPKVPIEQVFIFFTKYSVLKASHFFTNYFCLKAGHFFSPNFLSQELLIYSHISLSREFLTFSFSFLSQEFDFYCTDITLSLSFLSPDPLFLSHNIFNYGPSHFFQLHSNHFVPTCISISYFFPSLLCLTLIDKVCFFSILYSVVFVGDLLVFDFDFDNSTLCLAQF